MTDLQTASPLRGEFRNPRNMFSGAEGSIHSDATASRLGFKGGTVPGSIHMDQFVPQLLDIYGERWFETGGLSLYFTQATVDNEAVRVEVTPDAERARLVMFNEADALICEGTAGGNGLDAGSELARRMDAQAPAAPGTLRILGDIAVGDENHGLSVQVAAEALARSRETITEDLPAYRDLGILPPSHVVRLAHMTRSAAMAKLKPAVGLFGALEVQQLAGPLKAGIDYMARTKILKLTESPKTENVWYEVVIQGKDGGPDLGRVLYCLRFMKASSPLWAN
ncbi:hypothetical protein [Phenylobacterium koreense]|uniref:Uncharacterized protein n=1 Tax=Phenylobacterium koreense TaxID=266125 RepID=A0ABV2END8_9CAUL